MVVKNDLAQMLRKSIDQGVNIELLKMLYNVRKANDIHKILQGHYTSAAAQNLWLKAINNQNYSKFIDKTIGNRVQTFVLHDQPAVYTSLLGAKYYAKKIKFEITDIVHLNPVNPNYESLTNDSWLIVAEKSENEIGFNFQIFGPDDFGNNMIAMETNLVPKKIINQFLKESYRYFNA